MAAWVANHAALIVSLRTKAFVEASENARMDTQTETHKQRHTSRDTQTETHRQRDTQTETHKQRHTNRDTQQQQPKLRGSRWPGLSPRLSSRRCSCTDAILHVRALQKKVGKMNPITFPNTFRSFSDGLPSFFIGSSLCGSSFAAE